MNREKNNQTITLSGGFTNVHGEHALVQKHIFTHMSTHMSILVYVRCKLYTKTTLLINEGSSSSSEIGAGPVPVRTGFGAMFTENFLCKPVCFFSQPHFTDEP